MSDFYSELLNQQTPINKIQLTPTKRVRFSASEHTQCAVVLVLVSCQVEACPASILNKVVCSRNHKTKNYIHNFLKPHIRSTNRIRSATNF